MALNGISAFCYTHNKFGTNKTYEWLSISHILFSDNRALNFGGGAYFTISVENAIVAKFPQKCDVSIVGTAQVQNSTFTSNSALFGSAWYITISSSYASFFANTSLHFTTDHVLFQRNYPHRFEGNAKVTYPASSVSLYTVQNMTFSDSVFIENAGTALKTNIFFRGTVLFRENMAISGGAISLFDSFLHLLPDTHTVFVQNHAE